VPADLPGKKQHDRATTACQVCRRQVGFSVVESLHSEVRGSGWATLAVRRRLALGATTSIFLCASCKQRNMFSRVGSSANALAFQPMPPRKTNPIPIIHIVAGSGDR